MTALELDCAQLVLNTIQYQFIKIIHRPYCVPPPVSCMNNSLPTRLNPPTVSLHRGKHASNHGREARPCDSAYMQTDIKNNTWAVFLLEPAMLWQKQNFHLHGFFSAHHILLKLETPSSISLTSSSLWSCKPLVARCRHPFIYCSAKQAWTAPLMSVHTWLTSLLKIIKGGWNYVHNLHSSCTWIYPAHAWQLQRNAGFHSTDPTSTTCHTVTPLTDMWFSSVTWLSVKLHTNCRCDTVSENRGVMPFELLERF